MLFSAPAGFAETQVLGGLQGPTRMAVAPDGRIFINQQNGRVRVVKDGKLLPTAALTLQVDTLGERGLNGIVLDPGFDTNRYVYLYYTTTTPTTHNRVSRFTMTGDVIDPDSRRDLLDLPTLNATIHNSGHMRFGADGKLYVSVGDNQDPAKAQSLASPLGKVLRINPDGSIPTDNPFYDRATGLGKATWALGMRNPYAFDIQPGTGRMLIGDVGPGENQDDLHTFEEINEGAAGANFGWPLVNGLKGNSTVPAGYRDPVYTYNHGVNESNGCAVTGGVFYNPPAGQFPAEYVGKYFFTDYCGRYIKTLDPVTGAVRTFATGAELDTGVDLALGNDGSLYFLSHGTSSRDTNASLYKFTFTGSRAPNVVTQPADRTVAIGQPATFVARAAGEGTLAYQWQRDGADIPGATADTYTIAAATAADSGAVFRCVVTSEFGKATSAAATLTALKSTPPTATIDLPAAGGGLYRAGDVITFAGSASDPDEGTLGPDAFEWEVVFHHDTHTHPFLQPTAGVTGGTFTIPTDGETAADVWYRIHLRVTDSLGITTETTRDVFPQTVKLKLDTNVPGIQLSLDGQPLVGPAEVTGVTGIVRTLTAPASQTVNGVTYDFFAWSDGGAAEHALATPAADAALTAVYQPRAAEGEPVADLAAGFASPGRAIAVAGAQDRAAVRITNTGFATAAGPVTVRLFASTDPVLDAADVPVATGGKVVNLRPGRSATLKQPYSLPALPDGTYYLIAQVDSGGRIVESSASNNVATSPQAVAVAAPVVNLAAALGPGAPAGLRRGAKARVRVSVTNVGNVPADGPVTVTLTARPEAAGLAEVPLTTFTTRVKLKPGRGKTFTARFVVPDGVPPGAYRLAATVAVGSPLSDPIAADDTAVSESPFTVL